MEFPKLKFPPENYDHRSSLKLDKNYKPTFALKYYSAYAESFKEQKDKLRLNAMQDSPEEKAKKACSFMNREHKNIRCAIVQKMQEYLLQKNGVIDSWPNSCSLSTISFKEIPGVSFQFDFFGAEYQTDGKGHIERSSSKPIFHNDYRFPGTEAYRNMMEKKTLMEKRVQEGRIKGDKIKRFFVFLAFLYCIYAVLAILGDAFWGFGNTLLSMRPLGPVDENVGSVLLNFGWLLLALPVYVYQFLQSVCGDISGVLAVICTIVLIGACLLGAFGCQKYLSFYRKDKREYTKAKKELRQLLSSQEYSSVMKENEELEKGYQAMAEEWLREWFRWVCRTKEKQTEK